MAFGCDQDVYADKADWGMGDLYACYRMLSRFVAKAPDDPYYADMLRGLDVARLDHPMRAMLKVLLAEVPRARAVMDPEALALIDATPPLDPPLHLNEHPIHLPAYVEMGVLL